MLRRIGLLLIPASVILMAACGGSGGGGSSSSVTGVSVSCASSSVSSGQTDQCTATVTGTGNFSSAVTWTVSAGTISSSGLFTAPPVTSNVSVTITATSTQTTTISGSTAVTVTPTMTGNNLAPLVVDEGPDPTTNPTANIAYTTVTVCVPGTQTCQTIDHVQVDTGSEGLRLVQGVLSITLPQESVNSNPLNECLVFEDGYVWGPVATADITVGGETASSVPVQLTVASTAPTSCSSQNPSGGNGNEGGTSSALGANGIIGVGPFLNDCGGYCVSDGASCNSTSSAPCVYYECPASGCAPANVPLTQQVPNPVTMFAQDNNGTLIQLPAVPNGGSPAPVNGQLIFGIGTESNNAIPQGTNVYPLPDNTSNSGDFITTFNGQSYQGFLDSGSNALYFLDSATSGIPECTGNYTGWYCPNTSPDTLTATNQGQNNSGPVGTPVSVTFTIENAANLFNTNNTAFSTLSGPWADGCDTNSSCEFDWGLSFFFGRNVFTAIDTATTPQGTGPFFAF